MGAFGLVERFFYRMQHWMSAFFATAEPNPAQQSVG
jgi:hypothetical protein